MDLAGFGPQLVGASGAGRLSAVDTHSVPAAQLLVPAAVMPVSPLFGGVVGHDHDVEGACWDRPLTSRAQILLGCLVRLYRGDGHVEKIAHAMRAIIAARATTTMTMSTTVLSCSRNGLNPTLKR